MRMAIFFCALTQFFLPSLGFLGDQASGLVIYRFGGEALAPPPEADSEGVEFIQLSWTDLDPSLGGDAFEVDIDAAAIRALKRDPNFNIAPGIEEKGGSHVRPQTNGQVWDGDPSTFWVADRYLCAEFEERNYFLTCVDEFGTPGTANIHLGTLHLIDRIRVISGLTNPSKTVRSVRVHMSEEQTSQAVYQHPRPYLPSIIEVRDNREQVFDIPIPPHDKVAFVQVTIGEHNEDWDIHEIEIYARGFVEQSTFVSNILDFGQPMAWGDLRWGGRRDPKAKVLIQTRAGHDDDADLFWRFTGRGDEKIPVSRAQYDDLKVGEKAGTGYDQDNWSFWSAPYAFGDSSGAPVVSVSPRRYFQLRVDFLPQDQDGGQLDYLELRASPPVAANLVGEVWPIEAAVGQVQDFTYALRPTIRAGDGGFDRLELVTSSVLGSVSGVRIGDGAVPHEVAVAEPHRVVVGFPRLEPRDSGALVEVDFEAQVLRYGSTFAGRVWDSARPLEVPQGVNAGDATAEYEGNRVSVATAAAERDFLQVRVAPALFTPNGDGRNDGVRIGYDILEITGRAQVSVAVWDVSGRRVRRVYVGLDGIGEYERQWDGRDEGGHVVPPGIYLYRIEVAADRTQVEKTGLLYAAY